MPDRVVTLSQNFEANAQKYGARAFLKDKRDKSWTDHSWTEVSEAAGKLRAGLLGLGVRPGDRPTAKRLNLLAKYARHDGVG